MRVVAACSAGFAGHDHVCPAAAEEAGEEVADGVGNVAQADYDDAEIVGGAREGVLEGDVEEIQGAESDGGVVDC